MGNDLRIPESHLGFNVFDNDEKEDENDLVDLE